MPHNVGQRDAISYLNGSYTLPKKVSCTQGKDFEFILTVKMKTRNPIEGPFGSEFPAICNHCGVITA